MYKQESQKGTFLEQTKAAREERALEKKRETATVSIQAYIRGWLARCKFQQMILEKFDNEMKEVNEEIKVTDLKPSVHMYKVIQRFRMVWKKERDKDRFCKLCRYLVISLESESARISYIGVALSKEHAISWIAHIKDILWKCCDHLDCLRPDVPADTRSILLLLHTLVAFTATNTWTILRVPAMAPLRAGMSQLCSNIVGHLFMRGYYVTLKGLLVRGLARSKVCLKHASLSAVLTLATRPLILTGLSDKLVFMFLTHIFSVPALIKHTLALAPECLDVLETSEFIQRALNLLSGEQDLRIVFNTLEANYALCLLANLIHLAYLQRNSSFKPSHFPTFTTVATHLLESCQIYVTTKQSKLTHWHPVLGWFAQSLNPGLQDSLPHVKDQLFLLWNQPMVAALLGSSLEEALEQFPDTPPPSNPSTTSNIFKRALEMRGNRANASKQQRNKLGGAETTRVALTCSLYHTCLHTLTQLRLDILTGLCYQDKILYQLWRFLNSLGPGCGLKPYLNLLSVNTKGSAPQFNILILYADCMTHYVTILDDIEMYEQQKPFTLNDYIALSSFLNQFLYMYIMNGHYDPKTINSNGLFHSCHTLLMVLYRRDSRRAYAPPGHWLIKELRTSAFMADLEKGKKPNQLLLQMMPHIIPHAERVQLFRRYVANEKSVLGITESACVPTLTNTIITVHRSRIVEDGYRQLALLPPQALKGVVRVRFINEQGLDEAGIDQDGVFKEFLEETIKRVFDPSLNLFRVTSDERLYPSPTSYLQDNHLQLFEFVGRMLGKAVYEGIVVDVPFALFFLSQVAGQTQQALYSCMDELPSLDKDLYRSLTYIKHLSATSAEVADLDLTFSVDEDVLGHIVTHELVPGGRVVALTNQNKINYIHLMAHFRMHTQIQKQTAAFIRGFRSLINPDWLTIFSTPELQRLISGDNVPLDLADLRRHTQYYGGFHDSHRVVIWLWDILQRDFSEPERKLFLKFVTSCSKPPLLGFAHLEPLFSIRCVEVGDDEDTGDTIGSVIRGFFTIRKKDPQHRLPTSSTCFNLLKLPNYQRKSTLREKLRYAICSNTGFELS